MRGHLVGYYYGVKTFVTIGNTFITKDLLTMMIIDLCTFVGTCPTILDTVVIMGQWIKVLSYYGVSTFCDNCQHFCHKGILIVLTLYFFQDLFNKLIETVIKNTVLMNCWLVVTKSIRQKLLVDFFDLVLFVDSLLSFCLEC